MASKQELATTAHTLAGSLNMEVETEGLDHAQLTDLVKDLRAKKKDAETVTQADEQQPKTPEEPEAPEEPKTPEEPTTPVAADEYVVADGCSVTSLRGIIDAGQDVDASMFVHGEKTMRTFIKKGHFVRKG